MSENGEQMRTVDERLDSLQANVGQLQKDVGELKDDVRGLKADVGGLKDDVNGLKADVGGLKADVDGLKADVGDVKDDVLGLRVLFESHDTKIGTIAEVQAGQGRQLEEHGRLLREIKEELAPMKDLRDFVTRMADNHEQRIGTLEKHAGIQ